MSDRFHVLRNGTRVVASRRRQGAAGDVEVELADGIAVGVDLLDAGTPSSLTIPDARSAVAPAAWSAVFGDRFPGADGWFEAAEAPSGTLLLLSRLARARHHASVDEPIRELLWTIDAIGDWAALRAAAPELGVVVAPEQVTRVRSFLQRSGVGWASSLRPSGAHERAVDRLLGVTRDLAAVTDDAALRSVAVELSVLRHTPPDLDGLFDPPRRVTPPELVSMGDEVPVEFAVLDEHLSLRLAVADLRPLVSMTGIELTISLPLGGRELPATRTSDLRWLLLEPQHDDPVLGVVRAEVVDGSLRGHMYVPAAVSRSPERFALVLVHTGGLGEGVFHERRKAQVLTYVGGRLLAHPARQRHARGLLRAALAIYEDQHDQANADQVNGLLEASRDTLVSGFLADLVDDGAEPVDGDSPSAERG